MNQIKEIYVEIAKQFLDLNEANVDNMSNEAMNKIDEFLQTSASCSRLPNAVLSAIRDLITIILPRLISDTYTAINAIIALKEQIQNNRNSIFMGCYFAAKSRFKQELWRIFAGISITNSTSIRCAILNFLINSTSFYALNYTLF